MTEEKRDGRLYKHFTLSQSRKPHLESISQTRRMVLAQLQGGLGNVIILLAQKEENEVEPGDYVALCLSQS